MEELSQNIKKDVLLTLQVATLLLHTSLCMFQEGKIKLHKMKKKIRYIWDFIFQKYSKFYGGLLVAFHLA